MHKKEEVYRDYIYNPSSNSGFFPLDKFLGIENVNVTPDFMKTLGHFAAITGSFSDCQKAFKYAHLCPVSTSFIQKMANELGQAGIEEEDTLLEKGVEKAEQEVDNSIVDVFAVMLDGGRCLLRGEEQLQWKEVKVGAFSGYSQELDENHNLKPIRERTNYIGRIAESSEIFGERLWLESIRYGYKNSKFKVFLGDGAAYNWEIWKHYFSDAIPILDWYHATEHLCKASKIIFGEDNYKDWYEEMKEVLYEGNAEYLSLALKKHSSKIKNSQDRAKVLAEANYFIKNKDRIFYKDYKAQGLPIGSGVIEGGIKHLVNKRIKGTEKHWLVDRGNAILKLRIDEQTEQMSKTCILYENKLKKAA